MGKYATTTSIPQLLPYFLKDNTTSTANTASVELFTHYFARAEAKVDASVKSRYDITGFSSTAIPPLLIKLTEDIAVYDVIRASGYRANDRNEYMDDYKEALTTLGKIKSGEINLTLTDGTAISPLSSSRFKSNTKDYTPIFGLDDETNWDVDSDQLDDISDSRE